VDLLLVLLAVLAPVYFGAMALLAIGLCRAAKRGDELDGARAPEYAAVARAEARRREREREPDLALVIGGRG
jgi:hypothetical protein